MVYNREKFSINNLIYIIMKAQILNGSVYDTEKKPSIYVGDNLDLIHYNHSIPETLDEIKQDVWSPFVVFEQCANYPILHGVMAPSADEAMQEILDIIINEDGDPDDINLSVEKLDF